MVAQCALCKARTAPRFHSKNHGALIKVAVFGPDCFCILDWHRFGIDAKLHAQLPSSAVPFKTIDDRFAQTVWAVINIERRFRQRRSSVGLGSLMIARCPGAKLSSRLQHDLGPSVLALVEVVVCLRCACKRQFVRHDPGWFDFVMFDQSA